MKGSEARFEVTSLSVTLGDVGCPARTASWPMFASLCSGPQSVRSLGDPPAVAYPVFHGVAGSRHGGLSGGEGIRPVSFAIPASRGVAATLA